MVIFPGARFHAAQLRPGRSDEAPLAAAAGHRLAGGRGLGLGGQRFSRGPWGTWRLHHGEKLWKT